MEFLTSNPISQFVSNRRKGLSWFFGSITTTYFLSKFTLRKINSIAQQSRQVGLDNDNLERRFNLNLSDCQFTILALLPTLSNQILTELDVEGYTAKLANAAAVIKAAEVAAKAKEEEEILAKIKRDEAATEEAQRKAKQAEDEKLAHSPTLNPSASVFIPSSSPHLASSPSWPAALVTPPFPSLSSEVTLAIAEETTVAVAEEIEDKSDKPVNGLHDSVLGKSWSQVVMNQEGEPQEVEPVPEKAEVVAPEMSRGELWNEIKILSFARTLTTIYTLTLLTLQTHVQLNLLGRSSYVTSILASVPSSSTIPLSHSVVDLESTSIQISPELERKYLTFSWWLLHRGWKIVAERVREAVEDVIAPISLKQQISYNELSELMASIRAKIETNEDGTPYNFSDALFPPPSSPEESETLSSGGIASSDLFISAPLRHLLNETSDFLESADGNKIRSLCLDRLISTFEASLENVFSRGVASPAASLLLERSEVGGEMMRFEDVGELRIRLASLLPKLARGSHLVMNGMPNEYVETLEDVRELTEFSAIIYTSFDKYNLHA